MSPDTCSLLEKTATIVRAKQWLAKRGPMAKAVATKAEGGFGEHRRSGRAGSFTPESSSVAGGGRRTESGCAPRSSRTTTEDANPDLLTTIHEEILPRLALTSFDPGAQTCADRRLPPDVEEIAELSRIAASQDLQGALRFIEAKVRQGLSIGTVLLQLVAPAARKLGDDWLDELRTFAEVTLGLATLQEVVHALRYGHAGGLGDRGTVLLIAAHPGEPTVGIDALGDSIRRAGWSVKIEPSLSHAEIAKLVATERYAAVAISVSLEAQVEPLMQLMRDVKDASVNPEVILMVVGGSSSVADRRESLGAIFSTGSRDAVRRLEARVRRAKRAH
jgi:methanogenic corrinoid protein MtbC1